MILLEWRYRKNVLLLLSIPSSAVFMSVIFQFHQASRFSSSLLNLLPSSLSSITTCLAFTSQHIHFCLCLSSSSSPQAFPIICGRRNGYEYHSSTLSCPVRPPPLTPTLSISLSQSFYGGFLSSSVSSLVLVDIIFFLACAIRPFS